MFMLRRLFDVPGQDIGFLHLVARFAECVIYGNPFIIKIGWSMFQPTELDPGIPCPGDESLRFNVTDYEECKCNSSRMVSRTTSAGVMPWANCRNASLVIGDNGFAGLGAGQCGMRCCK
jgi:hypothetical protein